MSVTKIWAESYRPQKFEDYIFHNEQQKQLFSEIIATKSIPHLLLSGPCGIGKTTLAKILIAECGIDDNDVLLINASDENSVDVIRTRIKSFIESYALGTYKVVLLDEGDFLSLSAQAVLRGMMQDYTESVRFIITCNYENKIMPAIKSRCQHHSLTTSNIDDITYSIANILVAEKVKFSLDSVDWYVTKGFPDIRKIINLIQQNVVDNVLVYTDDVSASGDYKDQLLSLLEADDWTSLRKSVSEEVSSVSEFEELYRFLYENLHNSKKFKTNSNYEQGIITIADYLYKHSIVIDPEINFVACLLSLNQI